TGKTVSATGGTASIDTTTHTLARVLESDGTTTWTAGDLQMKGGIVNNNGSFTFNSAATYKGYGGYGGANAFNNAGSFTKLGAGEGGFAATPNATFYYTVPFNNTGTVSVQAGTLAIYSGGASTGNMSATAPGTLLFGNIFTYHYNAGATVTGAGTIAFQGGVYSFASGQFNPTGTVNFAGGTIFINNAFTPTALGTIGATVTFNNAVNYTGAVNITGSATFAAAETFSALTLTGTLDGAGDVTVTGALALSGGTMQGMGKTVSTAAGTLSIGAGIHNLTLTRVLESDGTATWTGGVIQMNGGTINNNGSFTYNSTASYQCSGLGGVKNAFNNAGSFIKLGASEVGFFGSSGTVPFNNTNTGTVSVQAGAMKLENAPNLSGGVLTGGTWAVFSNSKLKLPGSITTLAANVLLNGVGSIITNSDGVTNALAGLAAIASGGSLSLQIGQGLSVTPAGGTFTNHGTVTLGAGSHLSVAGAFIQTSDGTYITQLSGPTTASFGQIAATGTATVGGTLQATLGAGYDPAAGQSFDVVTGSSEAGTFSSFSGGNTPSGRPLVIGYTAATATITVNPAAPTLLAAQIDDGNKQRSLVRSLTFTFSTPVTLSTGAITLALSNTGGSGANDGSAPTDASAALGTPVSSDDGLTWTIPIVATSAFSSFGSLNDGIYTVAVHASLVTDAYSQHVSGGDQIKTFHRLFGDLNGDKRVNATDYQLFAAAFGALSTSPNYVLYLDYQHDGRIISNDYQQFAGRFGKAFIYAA
ncbi:MAG: hypothetical protein JWO87_3517, partial [Phycisphaerales bacterium]|nr:hypothetical protein [Phycisphaerales bacterium]